MGSQNDIQAARRQSRNYGNNAQNIAKWRALGQGSECILQRQKAHGKIEAHNVEMRTEEEQRSKMQKFMCKVTLMDVTTQFQRSKAKERK